MDKCTKELFSEFVEYYNNQYKYVPNFKTGYQLCIIVKVLNDEELNRYYYNEYKKSNFRYESKKDYINLRSSFSLMNRKEVSETWYFYKREVHCFKRVMRRLNEIFREEENIKQIDNLRFIKILKQIGWI